MASVASIGANSGFILAGQRILRGVERFVDGGVGGIRVGSRAQAVQPVRLDAVRDRSATLFHADGFQGKTVLIVDPQRAQRDVAACLAGNRLQTRSVVDVAVAAEIVAGGAREIGLIVVDIDSCGGISKVIPELIAFRRMSPGTPVILISAESEADDFSTIRLALCDVTLRGPVSVARLDQALADAQINNLIWQERVSSN